MYKSVVLHLKLVILLSKFGKKYCKMISFTLFDKKTHSELSKSNSIYTIFHIWPFDLSQA